MKSNLCSRIRNKIDLLYNHKHWKITEKENLYVVF